MPSSSSRKPFSAQAIEALDARYRTAGLVRSRHGGPAGRTVASRLDRANPEELTLPAPLPTRAGNGVEWLPVPGWDLPWLWAGFSTRRGGVSRAYCPEDAPGELNLGFTAADDRDAVVRNRRLLAEAVTSSAGTPLVEVRQFHSNLILDSSAADAARERPRKADGHMTDAPGLLLAVLTADCIPILVADRKRRVVAAFHAGWRGTLKRIVENGIGRMRLVYGSQPRDLMAAIGPGIGACCYAVGEEVFTEYESQFTYASEFFHEVYDSDPIKTKYPMLFLTQRAPGHSNLGPSLHVDLIEANRRQLLAAGLKPQAIQMMGGCTQCHGDLFFSHRGSRGYAGRMMAVIGIHAPQKA